jgi:hypothetical protein
MMHPAGRSRGNKKEKSRGSVEGRFIPIFGIIAPGYRGEDLEKFLFFLFYRNCINNYLDEIRSSLLCSTAVGSLNKAQTGTGSSLEEASQLKAMAIEWKYRNDAQ